MLDSLIPHLSDWRGSDQALLARFRSWGRRCDAFGSGVRAEIAVATNTNMKPKNLRGRITRNGATKKSIRASKIEGQHLTPDSPAAHSGRVRASRPRLLLKDIPKGLQRELGVGEVEEVKFIEISAEVNTYRDAVRFKNSRQLLLQALPEGQ